MKKATFWCVHIFAKYPLELLFSSYLYAWKNLKMKSFFIIEVFVYIR